MISWAFCAAGDYTVRNFVGVIEERNEANRALLACHDMSGENFFSCSCRPSLKDISVKNSVVEHLDIAG